MDLFTAALYIIATNGNDPNIYQLMNGQMWVDVENTMLSLKKHTKKTVKRDEYCMISI